MKKEFVFCFVMLFGANTFALDNGFYLGVKGGSLEVDLSEVDTDTARGILIGYQWDGIAVEFEANDADVEFNVNGSTFDADFNSTALYAVTRTEGSVYFKGKLGLLREEIRNSFAKETETGLSAGIGVGGRIGPVSVETEYTIIESDADLMSLGVNFHF